eukprot:scaffold21539_cov150-Isochrysis_galbana.AAC.2
MRAFASHWRALGRRPLQAPHTALLLVVSAGRWVFPLAAPPASGRPGTCAPASLGSPHVRVYYDDIKGLHAPAHSLKAGAHLLCAHVQVGCLITSVHQVTGFLHEDGVGRRERRARGMHAVHLQRHLVALLVEGNAGGVAGLLRGSDADARHGRPATFSVLSYFCIF